MLSILLTVVLAGPPQAPKPPQAPPVSESPPTYAECCARAKAEGKPLVVWVGTGDVICPACVATLKDEAIHVFTKTFPEVTGSAIVVAVPEGGELLRVADVTRWTTGDPVFGHVGSVRRALANWRTKRQVTRGGWVMDTPVAQPTTGFGGLLGVPVQSFRVAPANFGRPVMSFRRGGG